VFPAGRDLLEGLNAVCCHARRRHPELKSKSMTWFCHRRQAGSNLQLRQGWFAPRQVCTVLDGNERRAKCGWKVELSPLAPLPGSPRLYFINWVATTEYLW
jgi:hypothetical protein